jgi:hypothetical protein
VAEYEAEKPQNKQKPKRTLSFRQRAAIRLCELIRLRCWRECHGTELKPDKWLFVICHTLAPLKERDGGLDLYHLHDFQERHSLSFDNDDAVATIHRVCDYREKHPSFRNLSSETVGKYLGLTAEERRACAITQIESIEETRDARRKRQKAEKRQHDREYQRKKRRDAGRKPHAESASQTKPWIVAGFTCRRTWERHGKPTCVAKVSTPISISKSLGDTIATSSQPEGWPYCARHEVYRRAQRAELSNPPLSNPLGKEILAERFTEFTGQTCNPSFVSNEIISDKAFPAQWSNGLAAETAVQQASLEKPICSNGSRLSATARASSDGTLSGIVESVANISEREDYDDQAHGRDVRY